MSVLYKRVLAAAIPATYPVDAQVQCPFNSTHIRVQSEDGSFSNVRDVFISFDGVNDHGHIINALLSVVPTSKMDYWHQSGELISIWFRYGTIVPDAIGVMFE